MLEFLKDPKAANYTQSPIFSRSIFHGDVSTQKNDHGSLQIWVMRHTYHPLKFHLSPKKQWIPYSIGNQLEVH
jgi:hypothetical protein